MLKKRRRPLTIFIWFALHVTGLIFSIEAVMQARTEQGAVAWAISLNTIPVVAVPGWLVFGDHKMEDYVAARNAGLKQVRPLADLLMKNLEASEARASLEESSVILKTLEELASLPLMKGNYAELLKNGEETFPAIFRAIEEAQDYVLVQYYIIRADDTGNALKEHLVAKAKEGMDVYVLMDTIGSRDLPDSYVEELREAGVKTRFFMEVDGARNRLRLNFRNHRKIVVVDGQVGFVGGLNVGDAYRGEHPELTPWRDTHMRLAGPVVKSLQIPFAEDWQWATGRGSERLGLVDRERGF